MSAPCAMCGGGPVEGATANHRRGCAHGPKGASKGRIVSHERRRLLEITSTLEERIDELSVENRRGGEERVALKEKLEAWRPVVEAAIVQDAASGRATPIGEIEGSRPSDALRAYREACRATCEAVRALPGEARR